tara:strand:- start:254 stop:571 length:318 start_codon:yes stop_codon:yes gene_type:complete
MPRKNQKKYYEENKEAIAIRQIEYRAKNREQYHKNYTIYNWKFAGIEDEDFDLLYDVFMKETNCWICGKKFNKIKKYDLKCLDHEHETGESRYICCSECNLHVIG